jgi:uncharacterized protein (TIGR02246 family)
MKYLFAIILPLMITFTSSGQTSGTASAKAEERIKQTLNAFIDAWNRHDASAFSNVFTEDADFTNVFGKSATGRKEVENFHAPIFTTIFKNSHQAITKTKIRFIKPDVAAVDAWWEMEGVTDLDGKAMPARKGLLNFIMIPKGDTWLVAVMHNMDLPKP